MSPRLEYVKISPDAYKAMAALERTISSASIEPALAHLVKLRASLINGCAYCIDLHSRDARAGGETEQRINCLSVWAEVTFYSEREKAALLWAETLTRIAENRAPDGIYEKVRQQFSEKEMVDLTWMIAAINAWNRMAISFRSQPRVASAP